LVGIPTLLINPVNIVFCDIRLENWKRELKPIQLRHLMSIPGFHIELAQRRADKQSASKAIVSSIGRLRSPWMITNCHGNQNSTPRCAVSSRSPNIAPD
jgi:hypothetical protein